MEIKIQELSGKVLVITFPSILSEDTKDLLQTELEQSGFKTIWLVG